MLQGHPEGAPWVRREDEKGSSRLRALTINHSRGTVQGDLLQWLLLTHWCPGHLGTALLQEKPGVAIRCQSKSGMRRSEGWEGLGELRVIIQVWAELTGSEGTFHLGIL